MSVVPVLRQGGAQATIRYTGAETYLCSPVHKSADALNKVAKIVSYRNTSSPTASFLSATIAHRQFRLLPPSFQPQIKENHPLLLPMFSDARRFYLKNPILCGQGYIVTLLD